jgi:hypothetical protein
VNFAAITPYVANKRVFNVVVDFVIDSVRELLDIPSYSFHSHARRWTTGGSIPARGTTVFFSSPPRPDWFWCPASLISYGYQGLVPQE